MHTCIYAYNKGSYSATSLLLHSSLIILQEPLADSSSTCFWITGWWAVAALMLNDLKTWNNWEWHLSWRWWPFTIICTKLSEGNHTWRWYRLSDRIQHIKNAIPHGSSSSGISETPISLTKWLPAIMMILNSIFHIRLFTKSAKLESGKGCFLNIKPVDYQPTIENEDFTSQGKIVTEWEPDTS